MLTDEWWGHEVGRVRLGPSDFMCRKLVTMGLAQRRYFLRPEYRLSPEGVAAKSELS